MHHSQLARLRAMAASSACGTHGEWHAPNGVVLSWRTHTLQLLRGAKIERSYTFKEHVRDACLACMNDQEGVCIVLDRSLFVHFPSSGESYTLPLSFCPRRLFPMRHGVLITRDQHAHDGHAAGPHAYFVQSVFDTLTSWTHVNRLDGVPHVSEPFPALGEHIVHAHQDLIVTAQADALRIYTYKVTSDPTAHHVATRPPKTARTRRSSARRPRRSSRRTSELARRVSSVLERDMARRVSSVDDTHPLLHMHAHACVALLDHLPTQVDPLSVRVLVQHHTLYILASSCMHVWNILPGYVQAADTVHGIRDAVLVSVLRHHDAMARLHDDGRVDIACGPSACVPWADNVSDVRYAADLEACMDGVWMPVPVDVRPACPLTAHVLETLCMCLPSSVASAVLCRYLHARQPTWQGLEWTLYLDHMPQAEADHVLEGLGLAAPSSPPPPSQCPSLPKDAEGLYTYVAMALHILAQDAMLDMRRRRTDAPRIVHLLRRILQRLAWSQWLDAWMRLYPYAMPPGETGGPPAPLFLHTCLAQAWQGVSPHLDEYVGALAAPLHVLPLVRVAEACPKLASLVSVYAVVATSNAQAIVESILAHRLDLAHLPPGLAVPLEEAIRTCQLDPPQDASPDTYALLCRADALAAAHGAPPARVSPAMCATLAPGLDPLSAHIFHKDYRLHDVARMLDTTTLHTARLEEHDDGFALARSLAERTMAQCVGRGLFRYASRTLRATGTWRTPRLCLSLRTLPHGTVVSGTHEAHELDWPEFHNGVASALEIGAANVDSSWIFAHASASRGGRARHAGFLLGLGLHGHLRRLGRVHAYRYLAPRHVLTTVGLVLGLGASFLGTGDAAARQVMAVQVAAFLPPGSVPLHMSTMTQAAGLLGMGLVFCQTDHAWTAMRLASQLDAPMVDTADANEAHRDAYAHSAGLALGLVYLGRARRTSMSSSADHTLLERLCRAVATPLGEASGMAVARTAAASALALALLCLRSGRRDVAEALAPPTPANLAHIRPDLLLVRSLARALVLGDASPSEEWLHSTCAWTHPGDDVPRALAFYQIRAGACLALGLLYAGRADERARALLLRQLSLEAPRGSSFDARVLRAAWTTLQNVVHLALACVMAGTGDVDVLRVLRAAHGRTQDVSYGAHLATHMALGLLFLGGGRFSVATSDTALAMLMIACLPPFPASPDDARAHLPAARHLGLLAFAPRLLAARDVASGDVCFLPVSVGTSAMAAPTLLPPTATHAITRSRRYWPAGTSVGEPDTGVHWLHVQRRTGFLSYADDPHGHRSIFARTARSATPQLDGDVDGERLLRDLSTLVRGFDTAPEAQRLVQYVCRPHTKLGTFITSMLLDTLLRDAPRLTRVYLALWTGTHDDAADRAVFVHDLHLLRAWYMSPADARIRGSRERLLPRDVLDSVFWHLTQQWPMAQEAVAAYVAGALQPQAAWALALVQAPLQADLRTLRECFLRAPSTRRVDALHRLVHERLVPMCLDAWLVST